ncbi:neutral/alkaline non-lysosomal ceramidase N-terminal domain-containing protein [Rhodococcus sp. HNM0569]|uniref:neutral/alkaline non-lysosomal ceramidase N-terminal domain-containing protein n=1 Tax=Rhodococcus sp. HNM0569 TaxID=2716340 RepID=UPI00146F86BE|nr:neutral/alkaline non-lysosomal ceramidase N-terminal domain-containing protein [Rhodococcus sp. HNM0569]NLU84442.1 neutral/alkaline ceramidase [Rhodococcus sp. HNM0569]
MQLSRRQALTAFAATSTAAALAVGRPAAAGAAPAATDGYLVGAGMSDMTGAIAGQGMMGYSEADQIAEGLRQRVFARAFVVVDAGSGSRVAYVNADIACVFDSIHLTVLKRLAELYGDLYTERNVMLTATHNHNSCGGTAWDFAYTLASSGFRRNSFEAEVDGVVEAIVAAHDSLAPGTVSLGRSELHDASANRSAEAFDRNPEDDKAHFPDKIDPAVTVLRFRQGGRDIGAITWFATHGTSLTDKNRYISPDNKGYASYLWEHEEKGVRHLDGPASFVAAFSQTNAGDMTPNLFVRKMQPGGPTDDNPTNARIIGERQYDAGKSAFDSAASMSSGGVDSVFRYIDMSNQQVDGRFTHDGVPGYTTPAVMGAAAAATSMEDNWFSQLAFLEEGMLNPVVTAFGGTEVPVSRSIVDAQLPKLHLFPLGLMPPAPWVPHVLPLQIMRIGDLVLVGLPAEATIVAGLRIRRAVANELAVPLENVLAHGYANSYSQYITTPEEYDAQQYEGGETLYGRWTLPAYVQGLTALAASMRDGVAAPRGPAPLDKSGFQPDLLAPVPPDAPAPGLPFGAVTLAPAPSYGSDDTVTVEFAGAHPNNDLKRRSTYLEVQRLDDGTWRRVADDNTYETTLHWERPAGSMDRSTIRITWQIPAGTDGGRYRIEHYGVARDAAGTLTPYTGSAEFDVH